MWISNTIRTTGRKKGESENEAYANFYSLSPHGFAQPFRVA